MFKVVSQLQNSVQVLQPDDILLNLTVTTIDSCAASGGSTGNNSIGEFHIQANGAHHI